MLLLLVSACATPRVVAPFTTGPVPPPPAPAPLPPPRPPPHPEYEALRPFHNYYRLVSVGAFRHHFVAYFHHVELVTALYDVPGEPGAPVEFRGDSFGLITEKPPKSSEVPGELRAMADSVRRDLQQRERGEAQDIDVRYLGAWRPIVVEEICIRPRPGIDRHFTLVSTLAADAELTRITGTAPLSFGHGGSSTRYGAPEPPQWIDASLGRQGKVQLWKAYGEPSAFDRDVRAQFDAAVLVAARRTANQEEGPRLDALQVERETEVIPRDLEQKAPVSFFVNADAESRQQYSAEAWISPAAAFGSRERAEFTLRIPCNDGRECSFHVELQLHGPPLPRDVSGQTEVPLTIDWVVRTPSRVNAAHPPQFGTLETTARVWLDGPRVVFLGITRGVELKPVAGVAQYAGFEPHLGFMNED